MEHRLHLYMGEGKGKTTAAMGLALGALRPGQRVLVAQFLKDGSSGELRALEQLSGAKVWQGPPVEKLIFCMTAEEKAAARAMQTEQACRLADEAARTVPQLTVLDELALAVTLDMVDEAAARRLIAAALAVGEVAVTGRYAPAWLREAADYVSVMVAEKHPFDTEGLPAREGVEW